MTLWMKKRMMESQRRNGLNDFDEGELDTNKFGEINYFFCEWGIGSSNWRQFD